MLYGARDAASDVELRADRFSCLADLMLVIDPAGVDHGSRGTEGSTEHVAEVLEHAPVFWPFDTPSTRNNDPGFAEFDFLTFGSVRAGNARAHFVRLDGQYFHRGCVSIVGFKDRKHVGSESHECWKALTLDDAVCL